MCCFVTPKLCSEVTVGMKFWRLREAGRSGKNKNRRLTPSWLIAAATTIALALGFFFSRMLGPDPSPIRYTDLVALAEPGQAAEVEIDGERFVVRCSDGKV